MKMYLVDHRAGAALIYAHSREEAAEMADALGDVIKVVPCNVPMFFGLDRKALPPETKDGQGRVVLRAVSDETWEFEEDLQALLTKHHIALDAEEYERMAAKKKAKKPPVEPPTAKGGEVISLEKRRQERRKKSG